MDLFYLNEKRERSDETEEKRMTRGVVLADVTPDLTYISSKSYMNPNESMRFCIATHEGEKMSE